MTTPAPARPTLQDRVYDGLQNDIISGTLRPGEHLKVAHLAKRFGTSQAPVREALRRFTEEGLATTTPFQGTVLKEPTWDEIKEIYYLREELEVIAVRRIMANPQADLAPVKRAFRNIERGVRVGAPIEVLNADLEFHRTVCDAAGSPLTLEVWSMIIKRFRGARTILERERPDDGSTIIQSHRELLDALATGDSAQAEPAFRQHLKLAFEAYERNGVPHY